MTDNPYVSAEMRAIHDYERSKTAEPAGRKDLVQAIAVAIEPKFRGMGGGAIPSQIAYEVARTAVAAICPIIARVQDEAWQRGYSGRAAENPFID